MSKGGSEREIIALMKGFIPIPSISPVSGGDGESEREEYLESVLKGWGIRTRRYTYTDPTGTKRPSLVAVHGRSKKTLWIIAHTDTVGIGDRSAWKTDPLAPVVRDGKMFARGAEDDGHGIAAGMLAMKDIVESGAEPKFNYGLVLAADEENGSGCGMIPLLKEGIFKRGDMFLVPDWGTSRGADIEVAEKGILWLKITVHGKQVHASTPNEGINAARLSSVLSLELERRLHGLFAARDRLFDPPISTFEITKREQNVESVNIVPGKDIFYMDMRIIPRYGVDAVLREARRTARRCGIDATMDVVQKNMPTSVDPWRSGIVKALSRSIRGNLNIRPRLVGIGGGTVAAYARQRGFDAVVWGVLDDMAHRPNEYVRIANIDKERRVIGGLFADGGK